MHAPKPRYGWHGQQTAPLSNNSLVRWKGEKPKVTIRLKYEGVIRDLLVPGASSRNIGYIRAHFKPDPSRVPEEHFHFDLA